MTQTIDYYFSHISPWAYLGHDLFAEIARKHGCTVRPRPVNLGALFPETGGLPLGKRHPVRQAYRWLELQRWRAKRELPLTLQPAHFPADPTLADCVAIALGQRGGDVAAYSHRAFRACWELDRDLADEHVVAGILDDIGERDGAVIALARSPEVTATYAGNVDLAIKAGVMGSPAYVLNGEVFWGQDRLELLDDALASGRPPYRPL